MTILTDQAVQILAAIETASRQGWEISIGHGYSREIVSITAKRKALYPGARKTDYDGKPGITICRSSLRDALGTLLTIVTLDSTPEDLDGRIKNDLAEMHEGGIYDHERDMRAEDSP